MSRMTNSAEDDIARARGLARLALTMSPRSVLAHFATGDVLRAERRHAEAIPEYEMVLELNRNSPPALQALADCKLTTGSIDEVIPLEEEAIRLSPRDPQIAVRYGSIGQVHLLQSRIDEAISWLEKGRSANPELRSI